jgi:hypothetical protein
MRRVLLLILCVGMLAGGGLRSAFATEPAAAPESIYPSQQLVCPTELLGGCCGVYCPKPMPCIRCFFGCRCDDYCSKPIPCVPCYRESCTAYRYCGKPCPDLCRPLAADFFTCAGLNADCAK